MSFRERGHPWFEHRRSHIIAVGLYLVALIAWVALLRRWVPMPGTAASSTSQPGVPEAVALSAGVKGWMLYLLMWGTMMVAMMYPSSVPLLRLYYSTLGGISRAKKGVRFGAFLGTYTLIWTGTGIVPLAVAEAVSLRSLATAYEPFLLGGTLLLLAGYQLSPYKYRCLQQCRSPLGFLMESHRPGLRGAVRMSFGHSLYCVGCCWALFVFMVVVGSMNLVWMALITAVLSLERTVAWGDRLARAVGHVAAITGVGVIILTIW